MTGITEALIDKLSLIVDKYKYLIISGASGVGKTYLASAIVDNCVKGKYNSQGGLPPEVKSYDKEVTFIPIHESLSYEDFVSGISVNTDSGEVILKHEDKAFITMLKSADESWIKRDNKKYFLILDDIGRGLISEILGDTLPMIETHGQSRMKIKTTDNASVWVSPNVYIICTLSTTTDPMEQLNYGFFRHFYVKYIENDYRYMDESVASTYSDYDISAGALYYRSKRIVNENLRNRYQMATIERDRYVIGHGVFKKTGATMAVRYQVIPTLRQYVKDGILEKTAKASIDALENLVAGNYSKDISLADINRITVKKRGVNPELFKTDDKTHQPMVNLVSRIKEQGLLDDTDIYKEIMLNPQVLIRKKAKLDGIEREFSIPGYLYVERSNRDLYTYGTTVGKDGRHKRPRFFYSNSKDDSVIVDGIEYSIASEMQPGEYTRWFEDLDSGNEDNERYSSSPNSIMFRILRSYYRALNRHYSSYLDEYPGDENIRRLRNYANQEYRILVSKSRKLHPENSDKADVNSKANSDFRQVISDLVLFWKNRGETINDGGQAIIVEGVYKMDNRKKYEEYSKAMETLNIHQMIMQGPPGTSKTYSAREFLKFIGRDNDTAELLDDEELDSMQITNYHHDGYVSEWEKKHPESIPKIAWDIVQFHPSYGYEDFVRGIEVSTIKSKDGEKSVISYDTVNKILGEIAEVASDRKYKDTKFFLIIDEINRANLATVFGELIYGLEYRGKSVSTPYTVDNSNKVLLPENLYIIGTMNTADKSIGGIDYAIRRRFLFFSLLPDRDIILDYRTDVCKTPGEKKAQIEINEKAVTLFDHIADLFSTDNLNSEYYKDDVQIGHTYFLVISEEQLYLRFKYQVLPILREYYKDGMFDFDNTVADSDGWSGLLACVSGNTDINKDEDKIKDIFEKLIISE